jgi:hypothetical protein
MAFPTMNARVVTPLLNHGWATGASANKVELHNIEHGLFQLPAVVDVSGLEMAIATVLDQSTGLTQTIVTGATTMTFKPYDGNTNASGATDNNELFAAEDFSNSNTGSSSFTVVHGAMRAVGTSTTDLDADDWVNIDILSPTGVAGIGVAQVSAAFIFGKPSTIN